MKRALVALALSLMVAVSGCTRADWAARKVEASPSPTPTPTPRYFDEKVRCATVGERWEERLCPKASASPMCQGWWAYNAPLDTCVGVFVDGSFTSQSKWRSRYVLDMLTNLELEDYCWEATAYGCAPEAAKKRWITQDASR